MLTLRYSHTIPATTSQYTSISSGSASINNRFRCQDKKDELKKIGAYVCKNKHYAYIHVICTLTYGKLFKVKSVFVLFLFFFLCANRQKSIT